MENNVAGRAIVAYLVSYAVSFTVASWLTKKIYQKFGF